MTEITLNPSRTIAETFDDFLHAKRAKGLVEKTLQSYASNFKAMSRHLNVEQDIVDLCKSMLDDTTPPPTVTVQYWATMPPC